VPGKAEASPALLMINDLRGINDGRSATVPRSYGLSLKSFLDFSSSFLVMAVETYVLRLVGSGRDLGFDWELPFYPPALMLS